MRKKAYVFLTLLLLSMSCEEPILIQFLDRNLIFPRAVKIDVPPYQYAYMDDSIYMQGDGLYDVDTLCDTVNTMPVFKWEKTQAPFVVAALFNEMPEISDNQMNIINRESIVWIWHSGLDDNQDNTKEGNVIYSDGQGVDDLENKKFSDNPKPLDINSVYYWGVWAWNREGTEVKYSSLPLKIYVK